MSTNLPQAGPLASFGVTAGPRYGEQIPVSSPVITIGRAAGCELVIDDDSVSAKHARLEFDLGAWRITDLESTNGTAVEGVRLAPNVPTPLPYGATVRFGGVKMTFHEVDSADLAAARAAYVPPAKEVALKDERRGFRFPLWLALLVVILLALAAYAVYQMAQPAPVQPRPVPAAPAGPPAAQAPRP